jgi:lipid-A-disaccharide synthase
VEAALIGNPFVVVYRVSPVTYAIAKRVVTVPHVAMVNLIADKRLVPELIQDDFQAERIVQELEPLLTDGSARAEMMAGLAAVRAKLRSEPGETAIGSVAGVVMEMLGVAG